MTTFTKNNIKALTNMVNATNRDNPEYPDIIHKISCLYNKEIYDEPNSPFIYMMIQQIQINNDDWYALDKGTKQSITKLYNKLWGAFHHQYNPTPQMSAMGWGTT